MPLPDKDQPWPPVAFTRVQDKIRQWDAWYSGDPDALAGIYGAEAYNPRDPSSNRDRNGLLIDRPSIYRGGVVGRVARWFWGTPTSPGEKPTKLHIPVAGDIAATSADLLFGQFPDVKLPDGTQDATRTMDVLQEMIDEGLQASLLESAELATALGGVYLRVAWDKTVSGRAWLVAAHADAAVPEWRWDKLQAVTFWEVLRNPGDTGRTVLRHLERHEPGVILHGLYEGTPESLGHPVPFAEHADVAHLAGLVDQNGAIATGIPKLTVAYVPNMRPNRQAPWRQDAAAINLGRSDYAGVEHAMDQLDEVWSAWMRDIRLGKSRLIVPESALQNLGPGKGAVFDGDMEVYTSLNLLQGPNAPAKDQITAQQFTIRWQEHKGSAEELFTQIIRTAGYSIQTFGEAADVRGVTATEINARERKTMATRARKIGYWKPQLRDLLETLLAITAQISPELGVTPQRPDLDWSDTAQPSLADIAPAIQMMRAAEAMSIETSVRLSQPDWDDEAVAQEVARIKEETAAAHPPSPDPHTFPGDDPGQPERPLLG